MANGNSFCIKVTRNSHSKWAEEQVYSLAEASKVRRVSILLLTIYVLILHINKYEKREERKLNRHAHAHCTLYTVQCVQVQVHTCPFFSFFIDFILSSVFSNALSLSLSLPQIPFNSLGDHVQRATSFPPILRVIVTFGVFYICGNARICNSKTAIFQPLKWLQNNTKPKHQLIDATKTNK